MAMGGDQDFTGGERIRRYVAEINSIDSTLSELDQGNPEAVITLHVADLRRLFAMATVEWFAETTDMGETIRRVQALLARIEQLDKTPEDKR